MPEYEEEPELVVTAREDAGELEEMASGLEEMQDENLAAIMHRFVDTIKSLADEVEHEASLHEQAAQFHDHEASHWQRVQLYDELGQWHAQEAKRLHRAADVCHSKARLAYRLIGAACTDSASQ